MSQWFKYVSTHRLTILLGMVFVTLALMAWQYWGMNKTLIIYPTENSSIWANNDEHKNGHSTVKLSTDYGLHINCDIMAIIAYPFCQLNIPLTNSGESLDLRDYQELIIELEFKSSIRDSLQIYLQQLPAGANASSRKLPIVNLTQAFNPKNSLTEYHFKLSEFYIPSLWVYTSNMPHENPDPDLSNITHLMISTGDNDKDRTIEFNIASIKLAGKKVESILLYEFLLFSWLLGFTAYLSTQLIKLAYKANIENLEAYELEVTHNELSKLQQNLEANALMDSNTGIYNRIGMREFISKINLSSSEYWMILIEMDDRFSPDKTQQIGAINNKIIEINKSIVTKNESAVISLWKPNQLLILCNNMNKHGALDLAEHISTRFSSPNTANEIITCNMGISELSNTSIPVIMSQLESALKQARKLGKNKWHLNSEVAK